MVLRQKDWGAERAVFGVVHLRLLSPALSSEAEERERAPRPSLADSDLQIAHADGVRGHVASDDAEPGNQLADSAAVLRWEAGCRRW